MTTERTVEVGVGGDREIGGWTTCEKWGIGNLRGLHKIRGLAPLCQLCQETLTTSHPPVIKPTSPFWLPSISNKSFPSLHYSHFWKIGGIVEPPPPQVGVAVAIMQMVFSAVHYAHHCFYCHNASDCFC